MGEYFQSQFSILAIDDVSKMYILQFKCRSLLAESVLRTEALDLDWNGVTEIDISGLKEILSFPHEWWWHFSEKQVFLQHWLTAVRNVRDEIMAHYFKMTFYSWGWTSVRLSRKSLHTFLTDLSSIFIQGCSLDVWASIGCTKHGEGKKSKNAA